MAKSLFKIAKAVSGALIVIALVIFTISSFLAGFVKGYVTGRYNTESYYQSLINEKVSATTMPATARPVARATPRPTWGGPQLWEAVNKRRIELGVNPLQIKEEVCTIASIRLNQILELGRLDGHEGFSKMPTDRPDLKWIFEKYDLTEFLVSGATSAQDAVNLWENTLGHKELLSGGQYVWGCIYAQNGFGVAITAY